MLGKFSSGGGEWSIEVDSRGGRGAALKSFHHWMPLTDEISLRNVIGMLFGGLD